MSYTLYDVPTAERADGFHGDSDEPERGRSGSWLAVMLIVALAVTLAGVFPFRQIIAQDRQVDSMRDKLAAVVAENEALERDAAALHTDIEIERIAREQLGLVRPGEIGYTVQPSGELLDPVPVVDTIDTDDRSTVDKIWDFLTGRDLHPDG